MAKANVISRRIRAYARRVDELTLPARFDNAARRQERDDEATRLYGMLTEAEAAFDAFLASREKGPWAAFARAEAYP